MVAKKRRDSLLAARNSGQLTNQQAKDYIRDLTTPMSPTGQVRMRCPSTLSFREITQLRFRSELRI